VSAFTIGSVLSYSTQQTELGSWFSSTENSCIWNLAHCTRQTDRQTDKPVGDVASEAASFAAEHGHRLYGTSRAMDRQTDEHSHGVWQ